MLTLYEHGGTSMWALVLVVIILIMINLLNRKVLSKDYKITNPLDLMIIAWTIVLILHQYYFGSTAATELIYFLALLGVFAFAIGFWGTKNVRIALRTRNVQIIDKQYSEEGLYETIKILTVLEIVRAIFSSIVMYRLAGSISTFIHFGSYVRNLYLARNSSLFESLFTMILALNCMIGLVLVGVYSAKKYYRYKRYLVFWLLLEFYMTVITMSKMSFILSLSVFMVAYINNVGSISTQRKIVRRILPISFVAIIGLLFIIGIQRNYTQFGGSLSDNVINSALFYVTSPVEALSKYIHTNTSHMGLGLNMFKFITRIFTRIGILSSNLDILEHEDMIATSMGQTNAYTWYKTFFSDFSYAGFFIGPFIMGLIAGFVYKVKTNGLMTDTANAWMCGIVIMSFYAYMFGQSTYVLVFLYAFIFEKIVGRKLYQK